MAKIENTFIEQNVEDDFSVLVTYDEIKEKNYSFSAGQYFDIKIEYIEMTEEEFQNKINGYRQQLEELFEKNAELEEQIKINLEKLKYE